MQLLHAREVVQREPAVQRLCEHADAERRAKTTGEQVHGRQGYCHGPGGSVNGDGLLHPGGDGAAFRAMLNALVTCNCFTRALPVASGLSPCTLTAEVALEVSAACTSAAGRRCVMSEPMTGALMVGRAKVASKMA